ncbi:MAG: integrase [Gammaproteobacteria bacterium]|nr:integrase [Gammaproteobacteria bacterium]
MAEIIQFVPKKSAEVAENLNDFIQRCRFELTVFDANLDWDANNWPSAGVSFGNLEHKSRILAVENVMKPPFIEFAKAYFRYRQGHNPTTAKGEMTALKCLERALESSHGRADILDLNMAVLDEAATLARERYAAGSAYHAGRELAELALFVSEKRLTHSWLDWKNPNQRPTDTIRTGKKAKEIREKKLPNEEALDNLAEIFAYNPTKPRDIFTSSVCAMLLCAPSRVSEVLSLPFDCEVWETQRNGKKVYGWRFQPGKGGSPMIKWIPESMESIAQEAIKRVKLLTNEARAIAKWHEANPELFYRHKNCPDVSEDQPLSVVDASLALGITVSTERQCRRELRRFKLSDQEGGNTLSSLNKWVRNDLPKDFPWFDKARGLRYSDALFCLQAKQLRPDMPASPVMVWQPTNNTVNDDLETFQDGEYARPSLFDRFNNNTESANALKMTSHQFRHLLNTMGQRGGLSQSAIARWSGRADMKQNRTYDHMTEYELVDMLRTHDPALSLDRSLEEVANQIAAKLPMTRQEFNALTIPTAHVTEYGFCVHDFTMSPCQRFRDCLNCTEQVCVKGDRRITRLKDRYADVQRLTSQAEAEISKGTAGADRWYQIHHLTEMRLKDLIAILENPEIQDGAIVKLRNANEFSPLRRAVEAKLGATKVESTDRSMLEDMRNLLGGGLG